MKSQLLKIGIGCVSASILVGCFPPDQDPLAAASAAAKISTALQNATTEQEQLEALAGAMSTLTSSELASAVNLVSGAGWTLEKAQDVIDLVTQVDQNKIEALVTAGLDDPNASADAVQQALENAGFQNVTTETVQCLLDLFQVF